MYILTDVKIKIRLVKLLWSMLMTVRIAKKVVEGRADMSKFRGQVRYTFEAAIFTLDVLPDTFLKEIILEINRDFDAEDGIRGIIKEISKGGLVKP